MSWLVRRNVTECAYLRKKGTTYEGEGEKPSKPQQNQENLHEFAQLEPQFQSLLNSPTSYVLDPFYESSCDQILTWLLNKRA